MNYTENYHLPQWKKEDRIMMEDFNRMCADIESGLTERAEDGLALAERIGQVERKAQDLAESGGETAKAALLQGLFRAAWNHYFHLLDAEKDLWQVGVFSQSFARGSGGKVTGMLQQDHMVWTGQYQDTPGEDTVSTVRQDTSMSKDNTCTFHFSVSRGARVTGITMVAEGKLSRDPPYYCTVRVTNKGQKTVEAEFRCTLNVISSTRALLPVDLVIHAGQSYQIDVTREDQSLPVIWPLLTKECMVLANCPNTAGTATLAMKDNETNMGGLALAHFTSWGTGGTLSLNWDGTVMEPSTVRTITSKEGRKMQIAEFRRTTEVPASSTMKLTLTCEEGGTLELYSMGAILV